MGQLHAEDRGLDFVQADGHGAELLGPERGQLLGHLLEFQLGVPEPADGVFELQVQALFILGNFQKQIVLRNDEDDGFLLALADAGAGLDVVIRGHYPEAHAITRLEDALAFDF